MKRTLPLRAVPARSALMLAALVLAGPVACNRADDRADPALTESVDPTFAEYAPAVDALPAGEPAPIGAYDPDEGYAWAEQAYYLNYAFEDERPDYGYRYDDYDLWAWETDNGWYRIVEPLSAGERYYYYRRGDDRPFYVVDNGYGYGFDDGRLVVVYNPAGALMPAAFIASRADWGGRYLRRGRDIYSARERAQRRAIAEAAWNRRQARIAAEQTRWAQASLEQPAWRAWRARPDGMEPSARLAFEAERLRREARRAERRGDRNAARAAERSGRAVERALPPGVAGAPPRRDDNPGAGKRNERAGEVHRRNDERKAAKDERKEDRREAREDRKDRRDDDKGRGRGRGRDDGEDDNRGRN